MALVNPLGQILEIGITLGDGMLGQSRGIYKSADA